jgi:hypothetical protein
MTRPAILPAALAAMMLVLAAAPADACDCPKAKLMKYMMEKRELASQVPLPPPLPPVKAPAPAAGG